jgi:hypothetical protein
MTFDQFGVLAEILSALAVVITLAFLVVQMRQNAQLMEQSSRDMRQSGMAQIMEMYSRQRMLIVSDHDAAEIVHKGSMERQALDEIELLRFDNFMMDVGWTHFQTWVRVRFGTIAVPHRDRAIETLISGHLVKPGCLQWWEQYGAETFQLDFVASVDEMLGSKMARRLDA